MEKEENPIAEWRIELIGSASAVESLRAGAVGPFADIEEGQDQLLLIVHGASNADEARVLGRRDLALLNGIARLQNVAHDPGYSW